MAKCIVVKSNFCSNPDEGYLWLDMPILRKHYNSYAAKGSSGPIRLFNPLSVVKALAYTRFVVCLFSTSHALDQQPIQ